MTAIGISLVDARVRCPSCRRGFLGDPAGKEVRCPECGAGYPFRVGVLDLDPGQQRRRTIAQLVREEDPIARRCDFRLLRQLLDVELGIAFDAELELIVGAAELRGSETVLDVACGDGLHARRFAARIPAGLVVGLDASHSNVWYATSLARAKKIANVVFLRAPALDLPFSAARFDVVNCYGVLHLLPDVPRVLKEIARVLVPGGRFTVAGFRSWDRLAAWLKGEARQRLLGLAVFGPRDLETRLSAAGLQDVQTLYAGDAWLVMSARKP